MKELLFKFAGFCGVGGAMTLLSMLLIALTNELFGWHPQLSYVLAYIATLLLSYALNTWLVFRSVWGWGRLAGYCGAYCGGMFLGMLLLALLRRAFPEWNSTLLSYAVIPATLVWNFIFVNKILSRGKEKKNG